MNDYKDIFYYTGIFTWLGVTGWLIIRLFLRKKWIERIGAIFFFGPGLMHSMKKLYQEYPNNIRKDTLAEVSTYIIWRLTRIGFFA